MLYEVITMPSDAHYLDVEGRKCGHHSARADAELPQGMFWPVVETINILARESLKQALFHHFICAAKPFLSSYNFV